jgi:hypothetical protein
MKTQVYKRILQELTTGELTKIEQAIVDVLLEHPEGRTRQQLVMDVFGVPARPNINNDTSDRKNREAIASLFDKGYPILSNSGEAGYRMDWNEDAIRPMVAEWESRISELRNKVNTGEAMIRKIAQLKLIETASNRDLVQGAML